MGLSGNKLIELQILKSTHYPTTNTRVRARTHV